MRFVETPKLQPGMILGRDIVNSNRSFMLRKGIKLSNNYIVNLERRGYLGAYIWDPDNDEALLEDVISDQTRDMCIEAVESMDIERVLSAAEQMVEEISGRENISLDMVDLRCYDDYTYHHSVSVAVYSVAVGRAMGIKDEQLVRLCQAGLCHDLGKQKIPIEVLNKPGKLSTEELEEVRNHPQYAYDMLKDNLEISAEVRQAVLSHHENENGTGYPRGLEGKQLSLLSKIIHAVDVYDALISKRPYKEPYSPADAMEYLMGGKNLLFDSHVVDAMFGVIPSYPSATEVVLNTGEHGLVIRQTKDPARPIVKIFTSKKYIDLSLPENTGIVIIASGVKTPSISREVAMLNDKRGNVKSERHKVMLVDDSYLTLQQIAKALERDNYEIIALQSGLAAINYINTKGIPDVIVMDIEMPGVDGINTSEKIRNMGYIDLPIIFLTSKDDRETVMRCIMVHAKDYIVKPLRPAYLRGRIARALNEGIDI